MRETGRIELDAARARSLVWVDGELFDVASGWRHLPLDGSPPRSRYSGYGNLFDAVTVAPDGDVFALVATAGTKGLLLGNDTRILREINRSYYHANAYRYPIALFTLPDGRTATVHCPEQYASPPAIRASRRMPSIPALRCRRAGATCSAPGGCGTRGGA